MREMTLILMLPVRVDVQVDDDGRVAHVLSAETDTPSEREVEEALDAEDRLHELDEGATDETE